MSKPVRWAAPTRAGQAAEGVTKRPLRVCVCAFAFWELFPFEAEACKLAKVLTHGASFKLKQAEKLLASQEKKAFSRRRRKVLAEEVVSWLIATGD